MADLERSDAPIVISEDDARGADDDVPVNDTLVPMLVWGLGLAVVAIAVLAFVIF